MTSVADTRTRLLSATYSLMLSKGFSATSVDEICGEAGVSKGSFYHFFDSKQQVALDMIEWHLRESEETLRANAAIQALPEELRAVAYVRHIEETSEEVWRDGCLIGNFALELAETHPAIRERVSATFRALADDLEKLFAPFCRKIRGKNAPAARELAEQMLVVIEGGVVLSKAHDDNRFVRTSLRTFRRYLETLSPESR